jgi:two-component system, cell cycle sensor histidine kinase and response regulator CckA
MNVLLLAAEQRPQAELEGWLRRAGHDTRSSEPPRSVNPTDGWRAEVIVVWLPRLHESALARCRELRNLPSAAHARILAVGSWHTPGEVRPLIEAGADDYLSWPTDASNLLLRLLVLEEDRTRHPLTDDHRRLLERVTQTQKLEGLTVLTGGIAHDFNNLLAAILGNAELALMDLSPQSPIRYCLEQIEKASRRAAELTRQMLAYSARVRPADTAPINLTELVEEMSELLRISISKRCRIEYEFDRELPLITGDAGQLRQVVMNLLINASEATGPRGGQIQVRTASVPEASAVMMEVRDDGLGMDEETKARIFDPFFTTKKTGRGLGLAAVTGIVKAHQASIQVDSLPGQGTTFQILFPVAGSIEEGLSPLHPPEADWQGSGMILLVDDEDAVREAARRLLEKAGYTVLAASNGEMGLEIFRDFAHEISAVILDLSMPGMDGMEVFREIRKITSDLKVIVWSGFEEKFLSERLSAIGVNTFIEKPSHVRELAAALKQALDPARIIPGINGP